MGCKRCQREYEDPRPHCIKCSQDLNAAGLCCWCGVKKRKPPTKGHQQSRYCEHCPTASLSSGYKHYSRKYRGPGHRENTYETKHGNGH